jgi:cysteine desulfurase
MTKIYLDHSATTPVDKPVLDAMLPYFNKHYGNSSSIHGFGQEAVAGVDKAREQVAGFLNCSPEEVIFTSGATESDNLAIGGFMKAMQKNNKDKRPHVITSLVEHDAVLEPCMELEQQGIEVTYLKVDARGVVDLEHFKGSLKDETVLVSVMWVNSEVGAIMPIREIGKIIKKFNEKREREWSKLSAAQRGEKPQPVYFHTDATQAVNFLNCDVAWNYIDMLSLSGHKIYGPKGVGILYKRESVPAKALQCGGHHEKNLRSGTLNVPGIVGLGEAIARLGERQELGEISSVQDRNNKKIAQVRDLLVDGIKSNIPDVVLNTDRENSVPSHAHFSFLGVEGESLLMALDMKGIAVSTGSACASGSLKASHVLIAMGIRKEVAHNSLRFTLGKHNTEAEIWEVIKKLPPIVKRLRKMNPLYKKY